MEATVVQVRRGAMADKEPRDRTLVIRSTATVKAEQARLDKQEATLRLVGVAWCACRLYSVAEC